MPSSGSFSDVPCGLADALTARGFASLTPVQEAVIEAGDHADLRISSTTGSGKTVALGFALAPSLAGGDSSEAPRRHGGAARPRALVVAPTRELAAQIGRELEWLYADLGVRSAVVTGGSSLGGDFRALRQGPELLIGTPGRLVDHVNRGNVDLTATAVVALDEADEMLDMGFRDDLELLLGETPPDRRTHLVSATFPRAVMALADRVQTNPIRVEGTRGGRPNADIRHVVMAVRPGDKRAALVNVLLETGRTRTLVFVRTRAGSSELAEQLSTDGFAATALSGEMGQRERNAAVEAFRSGAVDIVVATDVAARGLDIEDVAQVVHFDPPDNDQVYTHRSGRTGRAGKKGRTVLFVPPGSQRRAERMASRLGVSLERCAPPAPEQVRAAASERLLERVSQAAADRASANSGDTGDTPAADPTEVTSEQLAARLLESCDPVVLVAALIDESKLRGPCEPRDIAPVPARVREGRRGEPRGNAGESEAGFSRFYVSWGASHGANKSRVLAMVCRRGNVHGSDVGAIRVSYHGSIVEIRDDRAGAFAAASKRRDPRNPNVHIREWRDDPAPRRAKAVRGKRERSGGARRPAPRRASR